MAEGPKPEEIHKEIESMMRDKFGDRVKLMGVGEFPPEQEPATPSDQKNARAIQNIYEFDLRPKQVKEILDRYVVKQDEAKEALAIAVCDHYNHVKDCMSRPESQSEEYAKQNILVIGPTGVGKTYLVKQLAKLVGVPFVKADATRFTEMGFVGSNVDDLVRDLVQQAGGDVELAQYGIVYLDEADKLATQSSHYGRDIGGRGVQTSLLKLMEETEIDLRASHDMASQIQAFMEFQKKGKLTQQLINTRHILFIVSGAFTGLADIIQRRLGGRTMDMTTSFIPSSEALCREVTTADLVNFGFEPEFVGRLPVRVSCDSLGEEDFFHILKSAEGSVLKQYQRAFLSYGIKIHFTDSGIRALARLADKEKTGARALLTSCERVLRRFKFELPSSSITEFDVTEKLVLDPDGTLKALLDSSPQS